MSNLINIDAESQPDIIGDDAYPTLKLSSTGGGFGLDTLGLAVASTASVDVLMAASQTLKSLAVTSTASVYTLNSTIIKGDSFALTTAGTSTALTLTRSLVASTMSVSVLKIVGNSVASGPMIEFSNKGFISCTSIIFTSAAHFDYAVPVMVGNEHRYIPLVKGSGISGGGAFG